jgi:hypothetical protein
MSGMNSASHSSRTDLQSRYSPRDWNKISPITDKGRKTQRQNKSDEQLCIHVWTCQTIRVQLINATGHAMEEIVARHRLT